MRGLVVDLRSLALFRVALGSCLLADLLLRIPQIDDFYTDNGVLPRDLLVRQVGDAWVVSLHLISGQWVVQLALFLVAIVFALGFIAGYRTRLCAILSWFLLTSMHVRNVTILHGGDALLRVLLFWCMFAPLNGRYSLDRALNSEDRPLPTAQLSPATLAIVFQLCAMYWFAVADKMHPIWLTQRSALYYTLSIDIFATSFGKSLLGYPVLLRAMTSGTLLLEFFGPLIALSPFLSGPLRLVVVATFIGFHAGLGLSLRLGLFPWICAAAWLAFLPGMFWDGLARRLGRRGLVRGSPVLGWIAGLLGSALRPIGRWLHRCVADHRVQASRLLVAMTPPRPSDRLPLPANLLIIACLLLLAWGLSFGPDVVRPDSVSGTYRRRLAAVTSLGQQWSLFSPYPMLDDGWFVIEGVRRDGSRVDVWNGHGEPTDAKPADFAPVWRNTQWVKYLVNIRRNEASEDREYFARYLCRIWNERHPAPDQVSVISVNYMLELTPPPGQPLPAPRKLPLVRRDCVDKAPSR